MNIAAKIGRSLWVFRQAFEILRPDFLNSSKINKIHFFSSLIEFYLHKITSQNYGQVLTPK